jgi:uncharacterized protein (DUF58 family)
MPYDIPEDIYFFLLLALITSFQMDLVQKFQAANLCRHVNIGSLAIGRPYPIQYAVRVTTRYGSSVVMVLQDSPTSTVRVIIPRRYGVLITDSDMTNINSRAVALNLIYSGTCATTNSYMLSIE